MSERLALAIADDAVIGLVLAEVRDMGPVTAAEVAAGTGLSESTARRHLCRLEEAGLIESENYQRRAKRRARVYLATQEEG